MLYVPTNAQLRQSRSLAHTHTSTHRIHQGVRVSTSHAASPKMTERRCRHNPQDEPQDGRRSQEQERRESSWKAYELAS
jgi:hypothetical protein